MHMRRKTQMVLVPDFLAKGVGVSWLSIIRLREVVIIMIIFKMQVWKDH